MRRLAALLIALTIGAACRPALPADTPETSRADALKAGYVVNFAKFVEWPASAPVDVLTLCFIGGSGVRTALSQDIQIKRIGSRRLALRELKVSDAPSGCDVLYVAAETGEFRSLSAHWPEWQSQAILTIGDEKDFARHGGVIGMFTEENRLRFNVNVENARRAGLKISSALLQLAVNVEKDAS